MGFYPGGNELWICLNWPLDRYSYMTNTKINFTHMTDQNDDLILESREPAPEKPKRGRKPGSTVKKTVAKTENAKVLPYRHDEKRKNNPEVGMVKPENDPDEGKTVYQYDPHLDPALNFDSQRAAIEQLIDDALASSDKDTMQLALEELKRLQSPYLN